MPKFTIEELPQQGQKFVIEALPDEESDSGGTVTDALTGLGEGFNEGFDATLNLIGAPIREPINYAASQLGYEGDLIPEVEAARRFNVAETPDTAAGRIGKAVGEVTGGSVVPSAGMYGAASKMGARAPGIISQFATQPGKAGGLDAVSAVGAGAGVGLAREAETGPLGEFGAGLAGGFLAPNVGNIGYRGYRGTKDAARYANRQVQRANDPSGAAIDDIADQMVKTDVDPADVRRAVSPQASANLSQRGFTDEDLTSMISRVMQGENVDDVARDVGLNPSTVRSYVNAYQSSNPTPMNIVDIATEKVGQGGAQPLRRAARSAAGISDDPKATQRLIDRQETQGGRTADIIQEAGSSGVGRQLDDEIERLATTAKRQEDAAYRLARRKAEPVNLRPVIRRWRSKFPGKPGGEVSEGVHRAIDKFFKGDLVERANARGEPVLRQFKYADIVDDVDTFLERRRELDQLIAKSKESGRPTPLTRQLTQFRQDINRAARRNNDALREADAQFSGNRTAEKLLERGQELGRRLNPKTRKAIREFRNLTPEQQELFRIGFEQSLIDEALNPRTGLSVARRFNTPAFRAVVEQMYPPPRKGLKGDERKLARAVHRRGQDLIRNLTREDITSQTFNDILSGSRTAPLMRDMEVDMQGAQAAADLATGRIGRVMENLSNRLARQIGERAATERLRILTETDPAEMLPMLNRLAQSAKSSGERQAYETTIQEMLRFNRRPAADIGTTTTLTTEQE